MTSYNNPIRACAEVSRLSVTTYGAINTQALIGSEQNHIVVEFCRRVQSVIWNRPLIKTRSGLLGLGSSIRSVYLYRFSAPVILRRNVKEKDLLEMRDSWIRREPLKSVIKRR